MGNNFDEKTLSLLNHSKTIMKKLPIGIQTFRDIIDEGYVYVDKTELAYRLINGGRYYFLSRPRRFGKSLFLDTLKEIFEGNKRLFKGLYIEDKWDFENRYPVLRVSLGSGVHRTIEDVHRLLHRTLKRVQKEVGISCEDNQKPEDCFSELIVKAYEKYNKKVVILIDEYDKPILDNITDKEVATQMRDEMKSFYSVIKDSDTYIQFVFITGVSKFSKMNLFSGLNNLADITLNPNYGEICGYTHDDLKETFSAHLSGVDMEQVRKWYNGYNYFGEKVYNPFDILLFISNNKEFRNYWWSTGNPSFLVELLKSKDFYLPDLETYEATDEILDSFDVDNIELESLLWQTGYLTIKKKFQERNRLKYLLGIPNLEIQFSLNEFFIDALTTQRTQKIRIQDNLYYALQDADLERLHDVLYKLFSGIPYQNFTNNKIQDYEGYYASLIYAYFASLGLDITPEDTSNRGNVDMTLKMDDNIFIFEFKVGEKATGNALQQIKTKKYYEKYQSTPGNIYLIGIEFSKKKRNIINFEWEQL